MQVIVARKIIDILEEQSELWTRILNKESLSEQEQFQFNINQQTIYPFSHLAPTIVIQNHQKPLKKANPNSLK